jgi:hypothetical protein
MYAYGGNTEMLHFQHKGTVMNTLESYRTYEAHKQELQLNEAFIEPCNPIFEITTNNWSYCNSSKPNNQTPTHLTCNPTC